MAVIRYEHFVSADEALRQFFVMHNVAKVAIVGVDEALYSEAEVMGLLRAIGIETLDDRIANTSWGKVRSDTSIYPSLLILVSDVEWARFATEVVVPAMLNLPAFTIGVTRYPGEEGDWNPIVDDSVEVVNDYIVVGCA